MALEGMLKIMRRSLFLILMGMLPLLLNAQEKNQLKIMDLDYPEYSKQFGTTDNPSKYFKTMIGDTIIFKGTSNREDFLRPDTLWIKPNAKKPVEGKHYRITKHYKTTDNDNTTPAQFIYEKPWIIVSYEEGRDNSFLSRKYECLVLRDAESGDLIKWQYLFDYNFSKNIDIVNVSKSREITQFLKKQTLYNRIGDEFKEIKVVNASMTIKSDYFLNVVTSVLFSDNNTYVFPKKTYDYSKVIYNETGKTRVMNALKNSGHYNLVLSKVEKPKNPQVRYGKMQTVSGENVTKYSYVDNFISIIWVAGTSEFSFNLQNKSGNSLKIEWDEGSYIDLSNSASRIFHSGVKYTDRDKSMPATVVPNGTSVDDVVLPTNLTSFSGSDWHSSSLIPNNRTYDPNKVGKTVKVLLPISVRGVVNEYTYIFKVEWIWEHPELRND